jgi:IS5 family transposase
MRSAVRWRRSRNGWMGSARWRVWWPAICAARGCERPDGGVPAETVLRCALLKQRRQLSYEELAFHLEDLASFRAFARLPLAWSPKKSVLQQTISALRP